MFHGARANASRVEPLASVVGGRRLASEGVWRLIDMRRHMATSDKHVLAETAFPTTTLQILTTFCAFS